MGSLDTLEMLQTLIVARLTSGNDETSYTAKLKKKGMPFVAKKLGEECIETVIAALSESDDRFKSEVADMLYHLLVLLNLKGTRLSEITAILEERMAQSGIDEKNARPS